VGCERDSRRDGIQLVASNKENANGSCNHEEARHCRGELG
jgi:hypothetical protein